MVLTCRYGSFINFVQHDDWCLARYQSRLQLVQGKDAELWRRIAARIRRSCLLMR